MPHTKMTDQQFRDLVVQRLDDGDRRFGLLDEGQKTMRAQITENTEITQRGLNIAKDTDAKVDRLIVDTGRIADERHKQNLDRIDCAVASAREAKESAEKTQKDVAGLVAVYAGAKVVRGLAVGLKGIVLYVAGLCVGASLITAAVLSMMGRGPVPSLFGH